MQVILLEQIKRLGKLGDTVSVKDGYARNFLIPQGKALRATNDNKALFEARKAEIEKNNHSKISEAEVLAKKIEGITVPLIRQAGEDGRLYGSIKARDIAEALLESKAKAEVTHQSIIILTPIKTVGIHAVRIALYGGVSATIKANVARTETEAEEALKEPTATAAKPKKQKKEAAEGEEAVAEEAAPAEEEVKAEKPKKKTAAKKKKSEE